MAHDLSHYYATNATPAELIMAFGAQWAICRKTAKNIERYGNCITPAQYAKATKAAIAARK
jgi:hypothetical protein